MQTREEKNAYMREWKRRKQLGLPLLRERNQLPTTKNGRLVAKQVVVPAREVDGTATDFLRRKEEAEAVAEHFRRELLRNWPFEWEKIITVESHIRAEKVRYDVEIVMLQPHAEVKPWLENEAKNHDFL